MGKNRIKPNYRRRVLRLPDLDHCKAAVLNSLGSPASRRVYEYAIDQFIAWYCSEPRLAFNRIVVVRYGMYLESRRLAASTINQQLAAVRCLAHEAAGSGLLSPELAAGISRVKGVKRLGFRAGNWLSAEQSSAALRHALGETMRAKRDYAMLAMLFGCGFRRSELVGLELDEIQMRQRHRAVEIGAGLSLYEAWRMSSDSSDDWQAIRDRQALIVARLIPITYEINQLQNEAAIFVERFERNFYHAMLTHTFRAAVKKLLVAVAILAFLSPSHAYADSHLTLVIAVDLSKSVAVRGADQRTEFQKNIVAITRLLAQIPAGATVTVIGITDHSFTEPYVLLGASLPVDPGYFGERLRTAHNQLLRVWQQRSARLETRFLHTDILGMLLLASQILTQHGSGPKELIIFSDMRQSTSELNLESATPDISQKRDLANFNGIHLRGVQICVLGVDGAGRSIRYWQSLREFWTQYFRKVGAKLQCYSLLRDSPQLANSSKLVVLAMETNQVVSRHPNRDNVQSLDTTIEELPHF